MKKLFQIVFYKDRFSTGKVFESKFLFEDYEQAIIIADKICKEKKLFFSLKELYL